MHVRNDLPDVQQRRPEVSAALAAVVERLTAKSLARRYASGAELVADLESALAIESARTTAPPGREATAVLRSLPPAASSRVPLRVRRPAALTVAGIVGLAVVAGGRGVRAGARPQGQLGAAEPAAVAPRSSPSISPRSAAHQYNPFGTSPENAQIAGYAIDGDPSTGWRTSTYRDGTLGKSGVGIYVDARSRRRRRRGGRSRPRRRGSTSRSGGGLGAGAALHGDRSAGNQPAAGSAGRCSARPSTVGAKRTIALAPVVERRYYLLWITSLGADPTRAPRSVEIAEFTLLRERTPTRGSRARARGARARSRRAPRRARG